MEFGNVLNFVLLCFLVCQEQGIAILNKAIAACSEEIERHKGKLTVKEAARAVRISSTHSKLILIAIFPPSIARVWSIFLYCLRTVFQILPQFRFLAKG